jgi:hypothetical protein
MPLLVRFCSPSMSSADIVAELLDVAFPDAKDAVDMTHGRGGFWNGHSRVEVTKHDLDPQLAPHGAMDFCDMRYGDKSFDVALFDPPHVADAGARSIMGLRFGSAKGNALEDLIRIGAAEAWRISHLGIVVKVCDHVHGQKYVMESDWVRAALEWRAPYEVVFQTRKQPLTDPKWKIPQLSARSNGAMYLAFRHGDQRHIRRHA